MTLGFIILRSIRDTLTANYWIKAYTCIRNFYPDNHILIIDDNSIEEYITEHPTYETTLITSEYPQRGELLPYYYFLKNPLFETAVILHDSTFLTRPIDTNVQDYKMIWHLSEHVHDQIDDETGMLEVFKNGALLDFYKDKSAWNGCFGAMAIVQHSFLKHVNTRHDLSLLLPFIKTRYNRCSFERVIAVLFQFYSKQDSLLGDILTYCPWGIQFSDLNDYSHLPIIKVWTGR